MANALDVADDVSVAEQRVLVEAARRSPDAFATLYRAHVRSVHAFAYRRCGSWEVAEEVTASTFERAWRSIGSFVWKGGGFEAWLYRIAANEIAGYYRREGRHETPRAQQTLREMAESLEEDEELAALFRLDDRNERIAHLREALSSLPRRYEEAITLRYLAGLSNEEAARAMDCSRGTYAVVLHRAMRALRKSLDRIGNGERR